jgi:hypothetical protein
LVIGNEHDPIHPEPVAKDLASAIPSARYRKVAPRYLSPVQHQKAVEHQMQNFLMDVIEAASASSSISSSNSSRRSSGAHSNNN